MEKILIIILAIIFIIYYLKQERLNRLIFTFFLRNGRNDFKDAVENMYINDAVKIKKYLKKNYANMIDVDNDETFKDIKEV